MRYRVVIPTCPLGSVVPIYRDGVEESIKKQISPLRSTAFGGFTPVEMTIREREIVETKNLYIALVLYSA